MLQSSFNSVTRRSVRRFKSLLAIQQFESNFAHHKSAKLELRKSYLIQARIGLGSRITELKGTLIEVFEKDGYSSFTFQVSSGKSYRSFRKRVARDIKCDWKQVCCCTWTLSDDPDGLDKSGWRDSNCQSSFISKLNGGKEQKNVFWVAIPLTDKRKVKE